MMRFRLPTILLAILPLFALSSCEQDQTAEQAVDELSHKLNAIIENPETGLEEVKKLRQFEYRVATFPPGTDDAEIERTLNTLGKEFFQCYPVAESKKLRVICSRRARTPLRYLNPTS